MTKKEELIIAYVRDHKKMKQEDIATLLSDEGYGNSMRDAKSTADRMLRDGYLQQPKWGVYVLGRVPGKPSPNQMELI